MGTPKASVNSGTTKTPPPRPTSEPRRPAQQEAAKTSTKKSRPASVGTSATSPAGQEAGYQDHEDEGRDGDVEPVTFERERHDGDGNADDWGREQDEQSQCDDGQPVAMQNALR